MSYRKSVSPVGTAKVGRKTQLTLSPLAIDIDEGTIVSFIGNLTEAANGKPISSKTIHLKVDGTEAATGTTDSQGNYEILYTWSVAGDFTYQTEYQGD